MKDRIRYFDIAKGLAILCVIAGHLGIKGINSVVFTFHMPVFFVISGYFLSDKGNVEEFIQKKVQQLLIPYILAVFGIIMGDILYKIFVIKNADGIFEMIVNWMKAGLYGSGTVFNPTLIDVWQIGAVWFLLASFVATIEVRILSQYKYGIIVIGVLAYWAYKSASVVWLPFDIQAGFAAAIFVYIGKKFKEYGVFEKKIPSYVLIPGIIIWGYIILGEATLSLTQAAFPNGILDLIGAVIGSYILITVSQSIDNHCFKLAEILEYYGKNTLIVLCAHIIELSVIPWDEKWMQLNEKGIPYILQVWIILGVKIIWATMWVVVINKITILSNVFHGKGVGTGKNRLFETNNEVKKEKSTKGIGILCIIIGECFGGNVFVMMAGVMLFLFDGEWLKYSYKKQRKILLMIISVIVCMEVTKTASFISNRNEKVEGFIIALGISMIISLVISKITKNVNRLNLIMGIGFGGAGIVIGQIFGKVPGNIDYSLIMTGIILCGDAINNGRYMNEVNDILLEVKKFLFSMIIVVFAVKYHIYFNIWEREYSYLPICIVIMLALYVLGAESIKIIVMNRMLEKVVKWLNRNCWILLGIYMVENSFNFWKTKVFTFLPIDVTQGRVIVLELIIIILCTFVGDKIFYGRGRKNAV